MESGIEVEGVWNSSRNNTPEHSRDSSRASSVWDHVPRKDYKIDLEKQAEMIQLHDRSGSNSTTGTARPPSSGFDRAVSAERLPSTSRDPSPDAPITKPARTRHPPSSLNKFSGQPYLLRQDSATSTLRALDALYQASGPLHDPSEMGNGEDSYGSNTSSNQSSNGYSDTEPIAASAPRLLNHQPRTRQQSTELDLMHHHRISQAAETGQLQKRIRKPGFSGEWASISTTGLPPSSSEPADYFSQQRTRSPSPAEGARLMKVSSNTSPTSPKIESLPPAVRRSSMPNVTPFMQFCQTAPPSPLPDGYRPMSADSNLTIRPRTDSQDSFVSAPSSPSKATPVELPGCSPSQQDTKAQPMTAEPKRGSFEKRASSVIRGLGTGFEILKPGTLNVSLPGEQSLHGPPVSLHNSSRPRSSSADSRRKLRKKLRPSGQDGPLTGRGSRASVI